jgi:hypothetical protein
VIACRYLLVGMAVGMALSIVAPVAHSQVMCPDGSYVNRYPCVLCPDGTYIGGGAFCELTPSGTYVPRSGSGPQLAPDGTYLPGRGQTTLCPDGTYVTGRCVLTPDGRYIGR